MTRIWSLTTKTHVILADLNKDQVSTTNRCYFDVNEFSTAAYWSFLLYNIRNKSILLCKLLSYNSRFVIVLCFVVRFFMSILVLQSS